MECFINIRVWLKIDFCFKDKGFEEVFYNKIKEVKEFEKYKIGFKIMIYGIVSNLIFGWESGDRVLEVVVWKRVVVI